MYFTRCCGDYGLSSLFPENIHFVDIKKYREENLSTETNCESLSLLNQMVVVFARLFILASVLEGTVIWRL